MVVLVNLVKKDGDYGIFAVFFGAKDGDVARDFTKNHAVSTPKMGAWDSKDP
jgi:hypothetical protein